MALTGKLVNRAQLLFQSSKSFVWSLKSQIKCYHNLYPALELTVIYHNLVFLPPQLCRCSTAHSSFSHVLTEVMVG